jgi:hypothetical protein
LTSIAYIENGILLDIKDTTFTIVKTLEYPYPISVFCYSAVFEVYQDLGDRLNLFLVRPDKLIQNVVSSQGSILMNLMISPDCLSTWNGTCFGQAVGTAVNLIFNP